METYSTMRWKTGPTWALLDWLPTITYILHFCKYYINTYTFTTPKLQVWYTTPFCSYANISLPTNVGFSLRVYFNSWISEGIVIEWSFTLPLSPPNSHPIAHGKWWCMCKIDRNTGESKVNDFLLLGDETPYHIGTIPIIHKVQRYVVCYAGMPQTSCAEPSVPV